MSGFMRKLSLVAVTSTLTLFLSINSAMAADAAVEEGKKIYNGAGACSSCHGPNGEGDGPAGASLEPKPKNFAKGEFGLDTDGDGKKGSETDIFNVITNGAQKYGGSFMMVGRPDLPEDGRKALAKFILSLQQ